MDLIKLTCNNCDAQLEIDLENIQAYCPYCGQKLLLDFHQVDKVIQEKEKTKRAQAHESEVTKRKQMDYEYEERKSKREDSHGFKMVCFGLLICFICFSIPFFSSHQQEKRHIENNEIQMTFSAKELKGEMYTDVLSRLNALGFYDIELIKDQDILVGWLKKDGKVEKVTINGDSTFEQGDWISTDSHVTVTYHTYKEKK